MEGLKIKFACKIKIKLINLFFSVLFYKSDTIKDTRNLKSRLIHQAPHSITGLAFKEMAKLLVIFVATEFSILTISTGSKDKDEKVFQHFPLKFPLKVYSFKRVLSSTDGCNLNCSTITDQLFDHQFIVARKDVSLNKLVNRQVSSINMYNKGCLRI